MGDIEVSLGILVTIGIIIGLILFSIRSNQLIELLVSKLNNDIRLEEEKNRFKKEAQIESAKLIAEAITESVSGITNTFCKDYVLATKTMNTSLLDHLNTLNTLITIEFYNLIILPRAGRKDKPPIDDVKATTDMLANRIMNALEPRFFEIFKAHGLSEEYIMEYMTREIFAKIIEFTRESRKNVNQL